MVWRTCRSISYRSGDRFSVYRFCRRLFVEILLSCCFYCLSSSISVVWVCIPLLDPSFHNKESSPQHTHPKMYTCKHIFSKNVQGYYEKILIENITSIQKITNENKLFPHNTILIDSILKPSMALISQTEVYSVWIKPFPCFLRRNAIQNQNIESFLIELHRIYRICRKLF